MASLKHGEVVERLEQRGFLLLEPYKKLQAKHLIQCKKKGHQYITQLQDIITGRYGCRVCTNEHKLVGKEKIGKFVDEKGWVPLNLDDYKNEDTELRFQCKKCGGVVEKKFSFFAYHNVCRSCPNYPVWVRTLKEHYPHFEFLERVGSRCKVLCTICRTKKVLSIYEFLTQKHCKCRQVKELDLMTVYKYKVLKPAPENSSIRKDRRPIEVRCPAGHKFATNKRYLLEGHGCAKCACITTTLAELELNAFFIKKGFTPITRNRSVLSGNRELDLYIPDIQLAIEYLGIRYHSVEFHEASKKHRGKELNLDVFKLNHQRKTLDCAAKGIRLISIFESEYEHDRDFVYENLEKVLKGELESKDLRWAYYGGNVSQPQPHFFDKKYREVDEPNKDIKYTVYDCGTSLR